MSQMAGVNCRNEGRSASQRALSFSSEPHIDKATDMPPLRMYTTQSSIQQACHLALLRPAKPGVPVVTVLLNPPHSTASVPQVPQIGVTQQSTTLRTRILLPHISRQFVAVLLGLLGGQSETVRRVKIEEGEGFEGPRIRGGEGSSDN